MTHTTSNALASTKQVTKNESNFSLTKVHILTEINLGKKAILLLGIIFIFMAMTSVMTQVLLPNILELTGLEIIGLPEPSSTTILADFFDNIFIIALIIILYGAGTFSTEIEANKQVYFMLSRPISRKTYYATRTVIRLLGIMVVFIVATLIAYFYGSVFYEELPVERVFISGFIISLSLLSVLAVTMMANAKLSTPASVGIGILFLFYQLLILLIEPLVWLSPMALSGIWGEIILGLADSTEVLLKTMVLLIWIIVPYFIGLFLYERRDL